MPQLVEPHPLISAWLDAPPSTLSVGDTDKLEALRSQARDALADGLPTSKNELWKHSAGPLRQLLRQPFVIGGNSPPGASINDLLAAVPGHGEDDADTIVLLNGRMLGTRLFAQGKAGRKLQALSTMDSQWAAGLGTCSGTAARLAAHPFAALNTARFEDAAVVHIDANHSLDRPIHVLHVLTADEPTITFPRTLIVIGQGAKAQVIESFVTLGDSPAPQLAAAVTEIAAAGNATLDYIRLQHAMAAGSLIHHVAARVHGGATVNTFNISLGAPFVRTDLEIDLREPGAHGGLLGLVLASGKQHIDNHTRIDHAAPHCTSDELYKHVLDDESHAIFYGRIKVHEDAQKTDAMQGNHTMLLSRSAQIDAMPQLEIYADDVKCTHGATCGQPDDDAIFYLRSRGFTRPDALLMLTRAFAGQVIERIPVDRVADLLEDVLGQRLGGSD
ncbi:MAG: Fe-S cluster assembly protein SufD [Planctomycetota bacterium]